MAQLLLVEDDASIRGALIRALTERGHAVTSTASAMDALQQIHQVPPDLVLLDLGLPDLGGYEALRMMRAISKVPVVVITARDDEAEIVRVLDAGADDYMVKPFGGGQRAVDARRGQLLSGRAADALADQRDRDQAAAGRCGRAHQPRADREEHPGEHRGQGRGTQLKIGSSQHQDAGDRESAVPDWLRPTVFHR